MDRAKTTNGVGVCQTDCVESETINKLSDDWCELITNSIAHKKSDSTFSHGSRTSSTKQSSGGKFVELGHRTTHAPIMKHDEPGNIHVCYLRRQFVEQNSC